MPRLRTGEQSVVIDEAVSTDTVIRRIQGHGACMAFVVLDAYVVSLPAPCL
jgi:hypothetical protein